MLSCMIFSIMGYHLFFYLQLSEARSEMKYLITHGIHTEGILSLGFDKQKQSAINWIDENEFILNGNMYDVIEKQGGSEKMIVYCIQDNKETELITAYQKMNRQMPGQSSSSHLLKFMSGSYILPSLVKLNPPIVSIKLIRHSVRMFIPQINIPVNAPPPWLVC